ncbi:MAG: flagellar hook-associated protein FlgL [Pseudomonadota bacterium]
MRISTAWAFNTNSQQLISLQAQLNETNQQIASGRKFLSAADDPVAVARVHEINAALGRNDQYQRNADFALNRLSLEEQALKDTGELLQRARELGVQSLSDALSPGDRAMIASEIRDSLEHLMQLANSRDGDGNYLFSGYSVETQPFTRTAAGVTYQGDQGQRLLQISETRQIADGDPGSLVFEQVPTGNGTFVTNADLANVGTGVIGEGSVLDPAVPFDGPYDISFPTPDTAEVRNGSGVLIATTPFTEGTSIQFDGLAVEIDGAPAAGDSFQVTASSTQDIFTTLELFAQALESPPADPAARAQFNNAVNNTLADVDQGIDTILRTRAKVGSRLTAIEQQIDSNENFSLVLNENLSSLQDVDLTEAVTRLTLQATSLEAAQASFTRIQGLSLFNYLR